MSEYLSKEEIKQWRSSLEKITLEEFAARLGKKLEEDKHTNDLVDIVLKGKPMVSTTSDDWLQTKGERINSIAERSFEREREISPSPFTIGHLKSEDLKALKEEAAPKKTKKAAKVKDEIVSAETKKAVKKTTAKKAAPKVKQNTNTEQSNDTLREEVRIVFKKALTEEVRIVFKKALTDREQKVFDHFAQNSGKIVYAKDLAALLDLPRDYVYKYIKNLRAKIDGDNLQNADKGGFILHV